MMRLLRAELRKLRFTRSLLAVPVTAVAVSAVSSVVLIASFKPSEIASRLSSHGPLRFGATNVGLFLLLFGVRLFTDETQHRTLAATYVATPNRRRVLAAKSVMAVTVALASCAAIYAVVVPITVVGVHQRGLPMTIDAAATVSLGGRVAMAMVLMASLGVVVGAAIANRTIALVASVAWLALGESLVGGLLRVPNLMPGALVSGIVDGQVADGLVLAVWLVAASVAALLVIRHDV